MTIKKNKTQTLCFSSERIESSVVLAHSCAVRLVLNVADTTHLKGFIQTSLSPCSTAQPLAGCCHQALGAGWGKDKEGAEGKLQQLATRKEAVGSWG